MYMSRIKVITDPSDLVPMFRAVDTKVKREVLKLITLEWHTSKEIEQLFGNEGREALTFFEKMKLVETRWQSSPDQQPEKAYHTYYTSFHINASWPVYEISDVLAAAVMEEKEFKKIEKKIVDLAGEQGKFAGDIAEALGVTFTMLKSLVKRTAKLEYRGHRIERRKDAD
jgi:predicted DNA-binding ArsR family transcriptional regulator